MEAKKGNERSTSRIPQNTPDHPSGFTSTQQLPFPPYGMPPGYTPPTEIEENHHTTTGNRKREGNIPIIIVQNPT
ncbi:hypothetical protein CR513_27246, partial [Mucuna pruriens]